MKLRAPSLSDSPMKIKLLVLFVPLIILSVLLTGLLSYWIAVNQNRDNVYSLLSDTVYKTSLFLDDKLTVMFEQLLAVENDKAIRSSLIWGGNPDQSDTERIQDMIDINNKMSEIYNRYFQIMDSIYVKLNNGREFQLQRDTIPRKIGVNLEDWIDTYTWSNQGYYWLNNHEDHIFETVSPRQVISVFKILGKPNAVVNGLVLFNLKTDYFLDIMKNGKISDNGYMLLVSPDGVLASKEVQAKYDIGSKGIAQLRQSAEPSGSLETINDENENMVVVYHSMKINNWIVAAVVPKADLLEGANKIKYFSAGIIVLLSFISTIAAILFAERFIKPVTYLTSQIRKVEDGNFTVPFIVKGNKEIGILANGLNSLVRTVDHLLNQVREEQEKKRKSELKVLQSQINPHFLYNTLASAQYLIDRRDNENASKMLKAIKVFFQIGISRGKEMISVREEIQHLEYYLTIQKMRYQKAFHYEMDFSDEIMDGTIVKLLLQPIVENSIYHGIKKKVDASIIRITGRVVDHDIVFEIYDDGVGIAPAKLEQLMKSIADPDIGQEPITFGLKNVNQRIQLYYGQSYGLEIESVPYEYTKIRVKVPFHKEILKEHNYV